MLRKSVLTPGTSSRQHTRRTLNHQKCIDGQARLVGDARLLVVTSRASPSRNAPASRLVNGELGGSSLPWSAGRAADLFKPTELFVNDITTTAHSKALYSEKAGRGVIELGGNTEIAYNTPPNGRAIPESADAYPAVAALDPKTRVIECSAGLQWVIQRRAGKQWSGRHFCRTKEALLRCEGWWGCRSGFKRSLEKVSVELLPGTELEVGLRDRGLVAIGEDDLLSR